MYRNIRAGDQLEIFLVSAAASLLSVRFYLHVTGYPQIGGGGLHIAHMLWGGALMLIGFVLLFSFLGTRVQRVAAFFGGAGFGIFIDEIGKFITSDNNYFFRPAVGIIYAIFVVLYLLFNFLSNRTTLTSREYQLNALSQLEEAILHDMDAREKGEALRLLQEADPKSAITKSLIAFLESVDAIALQRRSRVQRMFAKLDYSYGQFWQRRGSSRLIQWFFLLQALLFVSAIVWPVYGNIDEVLDIFHGNTTYEQVLLIGQLISSLVAAAFIITGMVVIRHSRVEAFEYFRRATLINLLLTEFFIFSRVEFEALPGFMLNAAVLMMLSYALRHEHEKLSVKRAVRKR